MAKYLIISPTENIAAGKADVEHLLRQARVDYTKETFDETVKAIIDEGRPLRVGPEIYFVDWYLKITKAESDERRKAEREAEDERDREAYQKFVNMWKCGRV